MPRHKAYRNRARSSAVGSGQLSSRPQIRYRQRAINLYAKSRTACGTHRNAPEIPGQGRGNSSSSASTASDRSSTRSAGPSAFRTTKIELGATSAP